MIRFGWMVAVRVRILAAFLAVLTVTNVSVNIWVFVVSFRIEILVLVGVVVALLIKNGWVLYVMIVMLLKKQKKHVVVNALMIISGQNVIRCVCLM
jgi:hypothetical protein